MIKSKLLHKKNIIILNLFILIIGICISVNIFNSNANEVNCNKSFSDDTIVTKDNIYEILDSLQIEYVEFEKTDTNQNIKEYTVGELKNIIDKINNIPQEIILEDDIQNNKIEETEYNQDILTKKDKIINKRLSRSSKRDGYELEFFVNVQYNKTKNKYIKTTGQGIDIDGNTPLLEYKIGSTSLSSSCSSDVVTLKGKVKVNIYIGVGGIGLLKIRENEIKVTYHW